MQSFQDFNENAKNAQWPTVGHLLFQTSCSQKLQDIIKEKANKTTDIVSPWTMPLNLNQTECFKLCCMDNNTLMLIKF